MTNSNILNKCLQALAIASVAAVNLTVGAVTWPNTPLGSTINAKPMTMLVAGKDHKLFYEAYNDASDIDGDGTLDVGFKPRITYYGLFDSTLCYSANLTGGGFVPASQANPLVTPTTPNPPRPGACRDSTQWSGNWLNYMTTSRIDALRKVLYGGYREIDSTSTTVLRRAYIPQDAHSWGKEYTSSRFDRYNISDYTPLSQPSEGKRHFFGNLTPNRNVNCSTLDTCSDIDPVLRIRQNVGNGVRIWQWASKERPVLQDDLSTGPFPAGTGPEENYVVRVQVCTPTFNNPTDCKQYPNGTFKPVGLLHEYGENDAMLFGLLTGSYDKHMSGGRLRKVMSSFSSEVNPTTGIFNATAPIVQTFDRLRIRGFNQSSNSSEYWKANPYADSAKKPTEGNLVDWGNPIGEMLYEATRYFAGKTAATPSFAGASKFDGEVGLKSVPFDDPYSQTSAAKAPYCSRASFITISDINPSFDSDSVPGSAFSGFSGDLPGLNAQALGSNITGIEGGGASSITGQRFIGQSGSDNDSAPTPKSVTSLGNIRGLSPEEPTKEGSYYSASMAYYAKTTDLRPDLQGRQTVDNYVVALSSPLPKIEAKLPNGRVITLVPFAKSVAFSGISSAKGDYQPTNQIVDFYVETIANSGPGDRDPSVNGGRYKAVFQINFEDVEQGGDHDMDAIASYTVEVNANNELVVTVQPTYQAGGIQQHMGYVISGTNRDGVYLVARDENNSPAYFLNVPPGRSAGYCDTATMPADCANLPSIGSSATFVFKSNSANAPGASLLKDPLWYAAKYGGFVDDENKSNTPDDVSEWDANGDGVPDTYFLVQNPSKLRASLGRALDNILDRVGSASNVSANSTQASTDSLLFRAAYNTNRWSGELLAYPVSKKGVSPTPLWSTSDPGKIPAFGSRNLLLGANGPSGFAAKTLAWARLTAAERALLANDSALLDYVRGDRAREEQNNGPLRDRAINSVLGDIVHSSPTYLKDNDTVFVGANDGMLHAFDARTGEELFGYMPSPMLSRVGALADKNYKQAHQYFVDGDIAVSTVAQTGKNHLVATLGRGGKGLFGLDVTNSRSFTTSNVSWEYVNGSVDADLGHMLGAPQIGRLQNGDWAAFVGNGYNSTNGGAVLYVFNLSTGAVTKKIDTGAANRGDNGLAEPNLRLDNNGRVIAVYAGDLKGNLWKFDFSGTAVSAWGVAFGGQPFFRARDAAGNAQPITAPVTHRVSSAVGDPNLGKVFVHMGTGSYFQVTDPTSTAPQTYYGLIDDNARIASRGKLVQRTFSMATTVSGKKVRSLSAAGPNDMVGRSGFFIDLPESAERVITSSTYGFTTQPVVFFSSAIPQISDCVPGGRGYLNVIDPFSGARLQQATFDLNNNGNFNDDAIGGGGGGGGAVGAPDVFASSIDGGVGLPGKSLLIGRLLITGGTDTEGDNGGDNGNGNGGTTPPCPPGSVCPEPPPCPPGMICKRIPGSTFTGRLSWREILRD